MARFGVRSGSVAFAHADEHAANTPPERTPANGRERSPALATQKVVGWSPIIRSESPAKAGLSSSDRKTMTAAWLHASPDRRVCGAAVRWLSLGGDRSAAAVGRWMACKSAVSPREAFRSDTHELVILLHESQISAEGHDRGVVDVESSRGTVRARPRIEIRAWGPFARAYSSRYFARLASEGPALLRDRSRRFHPGRCRR
jgi:hypothetical protein